MDPGTNQGTNAGHAAIGVDVGGSFTDVVCSLRGRNARAKAPTNPRDIGSGVIEGCELVASLLGVSLSGMLSEVSRFGLGTTAVTNALTAREGCKVGLLTTRGFESLALTARGDRIQKDGWLEVPWVPIKAADIVGLPERVDKFGEVITPLDSTQICRAAEYLVEKQGSDAIAISFLWSFLNPVHENLAAETVRKRFPEIPIFCGATLQPVRSEYERTMVAVMNAFCAKALHGMEELEKQLQKMGLGAPLLLLQASGGTTTVAEARNAPLRLAASGPAAGVTAAAELARTLGVTEGVCADVGGTSFDVAVITNGRPVRSHRSKLHGVVVAQSHVNVESIGSGGGSISWIDNRGMLRVGPKSARSTPGPACYGRGGVDATITDALLLLGYIDGDNFLGGTMKLDMQASAQACAALGAKVGLDGIATAWAIRETALADMTRAMRSLISGNGLKPGKLSLVAYGGGGPLFAAPISLATGIPRVLSPSMASVLSAFGAGSADIRLERSRAIGHKLPVARETLDQEIRDLERQLREDLHLNGVRAENQVVQFEADMQFYRQSNDLSIPLTLPFDGARVTEQFMQSYVSLYGSGTIVEGAAVELVTLRAVGIGRTDRIDIPMHSEPLTARTCPPSHRNRQVWLGSDLPRDVPVYEATDLLPGHGFKGPALVDAVDNTLWVPPRSTATVDRYGTISLELGEA